MITYYLAAILSGILTLVLAPIYFLPDATLNPSVATALSSIGNYIAIFNPIFPVTTLLQVLGAVIVVEVAIFAYKLVYWIIKKIPTIS